jgi:hypothetical protein
MTDLEMMAQYISIAESANQTFVNRQDAINSARELKRRAKKSFAYYGLSRDAFIKLEETLDRQMSDMDGQGVDPDTNTYAAFVEAVGRKRREVESTELSNNQEKFSLREAHDSFVVEHAQQWDAQTTGLQTMVTRAPIVTEMPKPKRKRWWQFWR